ncbi:MAG: hypothetical protein KF752_11360 [Pirellulaceae bacterium]|nr:hypothetical protein [Pirellulaceae bacterium]
MNNFVWKSALILVGLLCAVGTWPGCSRKGYRAKTDREVQYLLEEKRLESCEANATPINIQVDPQSRMFDPFNPDRPPMPEDDPQANRYMRMVDKKKGYPLWEANGRTNQAENPDWVSCLPLDQRGVLVLNLEQAVRLALLHSPNYQRNVEEVYLSALDVSSERFRFDSQFFGGWRAGYNTTGPYRNNAVIPGSTSTWSTGPNSVGRRDWAMQKRFATGADLVVGLANDITWQIAGPNSQSSRTLLDFSLVQPLLRQAGRDIVLERLTLAERTLLANIRAFERYRRAFYVQVAVGLNPDTQPQRRGGVFGGAGFGGFTGLGGGFGTLGTGNTGTGLGGLAGNNIPGARGFFGLLQDQLQIANQQETVTQLTEVYLQLLDSYNEQLTTVPKSQSAIPQQKLQVVQALQNIYNQQTNLLQSRAAFEDSLDNFKGTLGLPPYLCVEISDPMLDQFKLVSQQLRERRSQLAAVRVVVGENSSQILELSRTEIDAQSGASFRALAATPSLTNQLTELANRLKPLRQIRETIVGTDLPQIRADIATLRAAIPQRRRQLDRLLEITRSEQGVVCTILPTGALNFSFLDGEGLEELPDQLASDLDRFEQRFEEHARAGAQLEQRIQEISDGLYKFADDSQRFEAISTDVVLGIQDSVAAMSDDVLAIQLLQARARTESVLLPEVDIDTRDAVEIARVNRHDWLNNRAALVNRWRVIEVVADELESFLDLTISGDLQNYGPNPLALRGSTGRMTMGLQWDAPITRLQERNNYRQALIEYQQAKRAYYRFEDSVWQGMRTTLRTIRQRQLAFELQRFAVQTAAQQISVNEDVRQINETLGVVSPTAARDTITALNDLLLTQSELIGIFVNYEALRRVLDLNLGTMELDAEGLWIDPGPIRADTLGGRLSDAVLNYGLTTNQQQFRQQVLNAHLAEGRNPLPLELATSDTLPPSPIAAYVSEDSAVAQAYDPQFDADLQPTDNTE